MIAIMIVPTGIGAEIGGHSGDATSAAHLLAACCDQLITHPNVLNASDLSSIPANCLYVEGSMIDDMLAGNIGLRERRRANRILVACNEAGPETVNAVNAARSIHGVEADIVTLDPTLHMSGRLSEAGDQATGNISGMTEFVEQIRGSSHDAIAVHTPVHVEREVMEHYLAHGGVNPWGGVEAMFSRAASRRLGRPVAHAPMETIPDSRAYDKTVSDARLSPEMICGSHLVSVLAGLRRAPLVGSPEQILGCIQSYEIDALISPMCWGTPHDLAVEAGIPVILVFANSTTQSERAAAAEGKKGVTVVSNYLEAAGALTMMRLGRSLESVTRPLDGAEVLP